MLQLLPDDDPDLVRPLDAERVTGMDGQQIYLAIFEGRVRGGPDRHGLVRVSLHGLRTLQQAGERGRAAPA